MKLADLEQEAEDFRRCGDYAFVPGMTSGSLKRLMADFASYKLEQAAQKCEERQQSETCCAEQIRAMKSGVGE